MNGGCVFFFFSRRRRHTRLQGDWSSDVCSSDLYRTPGGRPSLRRARARSEDRVLQIGRASCRERGEISVVAVSLKKKKTKKEGSSTDAASHATTDAAQIRYHRL